MLLIFGFFGSASFCLADGPTGARVKPGKDYFIDQLSQVRKTHEKNLATIDERLLELTQEAGTSAMADESNFKGVKNQIFKLDQERKEEALRVEFFEKLRTQFSDYYTNSPVVAFLQERITSLASQEFGISSSLSEGRANLKHFYISLKAGLATSNVDAANVIPWIEGFTARSTILNPKDPYRLGNEAHYTDGLTSELSQGKNLEEAGDFVDKKMSSKVSAPVGVSKIKSSIEVKDKKTKETSNYE